MSRNRMRMTFWIGVMASVLPATAAMMAVSSQGNGNDVEGVWDGFYRTADGAMGTAATEFVGANRHAIAGQGALSDWGDSDVDYRILATLRGQTWIAGQGESSIGPVSFAGDIAEFRLRNDVAKAMSAQYRFGGEAGASALLLHPFRTVGPDLAGAGDGKFQSAPDPENPTYIPDPTFAGISGLEFSSINARGLFAGRVEFDRGPNFPLLSWPVMATVSEGNRFVMIGQGATGRLVYDGVVTPPTASKPTTAIDGFARLQFFSGGSQFTAINVTLSRRL